MSRNTNGSSSLYSFSIPMTALHQSANVITFISTDGNKSLFTNRPFKAGQVIDVLPRVSEQDYPTRYTVQTGPNQHIDIGEVWACGNHSCAPTMLFDMRRMLVTATRDLKAGEELTFFYPSTEWDMAEPFVCHCHSSECLQHIAGARYIPTSVLEGYFLNDHIAALVTERDAQNDTAETHEEQHTNGISNGTSNGNGHAEHHHRINGK
ncbi:SET domain-containing protein [Myxococcota bacterium]|nr:SET domain-containing protein [Myxococcota bacterium]